MLIVSFDRKLVHETKSSSLLATKAFCDKLSTRKRVSKFVVSKQVLIVKLSNISHVENIYLSIPLIVLPLIMSPHLIISGSVS